MIETAAKGQEKKMAVLRSKIGEVYPTSTCEEEWNIYNTLVEATRSAEDPHAVLHLAATQMGVRFESIRTKLVSSTSVNLADVHVSNFCIVLLAASLRLYPDVNSLVLGPQHLTTPLLLILLEGLEGTNIQSIDVSDNPIGSLGVQAIYQLVARKPQFKAVRIDGIQCVPSLHRKLQRVLDDRKSLQICV